MTIPGLYRGRNRTFLFSNVELVRFVQGVTFVGTVPDPRQLQGDFSSARNAAGREVIIYDPATTRPNPSGAGFLRTAFPGNLIPASRIDPVARNVMRYFVAPNTAGNPFTGVGNWTGVGGNRVTKDSFTLRVDHHFASSNRLFLRYSYDDTPLDRAKPFGRENPANPAFGAQIFNRQNAVIEDAHTFSPTLLATVRYSITRLGNRREAFSTGFDITTLGLPRSLQEQIVEPVAFPFINITGFNVTASIPNTIPNSTLGAGDFIRLGDTAHAWQGNLTQTLRRHTLKYGGEFRVIQFNNQQTAANAVEFAFTPAWTQGPNPAQASATAGLGLATFLLGIAGGGVRPVPPVTQSIHYHALFIQDTYKVTNGLSLNLGLRWEYETPRRDRFDQLTNFDFNALSPLAAPGFEVRGGLTFVNTGGLSRYNANPDRNNLAPRLGLAWQLTPKTVIRSGGGLFFTSATGIGTGSAAFGISGFQANTDIVTSLDGVTPIFNWSNPFPQGINRPSGSSLGLATLLGQSVQFFNRGNRQPYSAQWNFNIQRELPFALLFEVGYAGSRGLKLPQARLWNQLPDRFLTLGEELRTLVSNPFAGRISVGPLAQARVTRAQLLRPFPHFTAVTSQSEHWASSSYHALESRLEKRFTHDVTFLASYTYSKLMDYGIGSFAGEVLSEQTFQNWNALHHEWASSTADMTHRFIVNAVYELPFGRGQKGVAGRVLSGWQLAGIWSAFSGGPLGVTSAVNNTFSQGGGQRPNWTGVNPRLENPRPERWLDAAVFSNPAPFTFGNAPRTFNSARSDGVSGLDLTLSKNMRLAERYLLQLRAECFNISNTPRFDPPNVVFGNPQFGVVNAQSNQPRVVQFALKLSY